LIFLPLSFTRVTLNRCHYTPDFFNIYRLFLSIITLYQMPLYNLFSKSLHCIIIVVPLIFAIITLSRHYWYCWFLYSIHWINEINTPNLFNKYPVLIIFIQLLFITITPDEWRFIRLTLSIITLNGNIYTADFFKDYTRSIIWIQLNLLNFTLYDIIDTTDLLNRYPAWVLSIPLTFLMITINQYFNTSLLFQLLLWIRVNIQLTFSLFTLNQCYLYGWFSSRVTLVSIPLYFYFIFIITL
jgi:hypothetical protein